MMTSYRADPEVFKRMMCKAAKAVRRFQCQALQDSSTHKQHGNATHSITQQHGEDDGSTVRDAAD